MLAPPEGFEPPSDALEERCLNPLDHGGIFMVRMVGLEPTELRF
jgi:hypothetical protein